MERELWTAIVRLITRVRTVYDARHTYSDRDIVLVFLWAVLHDRPVSWACRRASWPIHDRTRRLPVPSTMTRRLPTPSVRAMLSELESEVRQVLGKDDLVFAIDGKPLVIGGNSGDPDAGFGRGAGGMARGYKLHAIVGESSAIWEWEVQPINIDERKVAKRLIRRASIHDVLLGDKNYDAGYLFDAAGVKGIQLLTARRQGSDRGLGHRRQSRWRLKCIEGIERDQQGSASSLLASRDFIERVFGNLVSAGYGLGPLPAWVRRIGRVRRWVQAKLTIFMLARAMLRPG